MSWHLTIIAFHLSKLYGDNITFNNIPIGKALAKISIDFFTRNVEERQFRKCFILHLVLRRHYIFFFILHSPRWSCWPSLRSYRVIKVTVLSKFDIRALNRIRHNGNNINRCSIILIKYIRNGNEFIAFPKTWSSAKGTFRNEIRILVDFIFFLRKSKIVVDCWWWVWFVVFLWLFENIVEFVFLVLFAEWRVKAKGVRLQLHWCCCLGIFRFS